MPSKTVNPDLVRERQKASFNVEEFTIWWHDGETKNEERRALGKSAILCNCNFAEVNDMKKLR